MLDALIPMVIMTTMFVMIFGIAYLRNRENMAMIEKGLNPRIKDASPRPFINLKWGLLLIGCGLGLLSAYIIDNTLLDHSKTRPGTNITILGHHSGGKNKLAVLADTAHNKDTGLAERKTISRNDDGDSGEAHSVAEIRGGGDDNPTIYFALIAIGGGLGLFFSYRIEKKEWLDKKITV